MMKKWKYGLLVLGSCTILGTMFMGRYGEYTDSKTEYENYCKEYDDLTNELLVEKMSLIKLQTIETEYEDALYQSLIAYYNESDDEVFRRVFEERFSLLGEYEEARQNAFIIIYALFETYPEIKEDKDISKLISNIDDTTDKLNIAIHEYNNLCDNVIDTIKRVNSCSYVTEWTEGNQILTLPAYIKVME